MARTYKTSTSVCPMIYVGLYESLMAPSNLFNYDMEQAEENGMEEVDFDIDKYRADVGRIAARIVEKHQSDLTNDNSFGIVKISSNGHIEPPRGGFYNFETDSLYLDIEVADDFVEVACKNLEEWKDDDKVKKCFDENFKSRDGFHSWLPQSIDAMILALKCDEKANYWRSYDLLVGAYTALCFAHSSLFDDTDPYCDGNWRENIQSELLEELNDLNYEDYATLKPMAEQTA